ncbi:MAG: LysR family transcriptional regulator [Cellulomonas sp. 73-145]|uniref:RidA family protein n=1 Tax=Cellulomonas sp. 73-145 TaxID=1895739 RepID=UPI000928DA61|nr:RidA family protein [Cellulomonas sp. 73-145]MBN9326055.1 RidA family protein [Cellulomonas sp.]OJV59036.1 MAG: LysR family transcriptional regulator [Cellulomonas sp. 73-145]
MSVADRLAELGLQLPSSAAPVGAYVPAVRTGSYVWTSGQLPFVSGGLTVTGIVGLTPGQVTPPAATEQARIAALNALAAVGSLLAGPGGDAVAALDRVVRVVKVVGFVASDPTFTGQPAVLNGASELLHALLGDAGVHARSAVGVAALPLGAPVEVELVVEVA